MPSRSHSLADLQTQHADVRSLGAGPTLAWLLRARSDHPLAAAASNQLQGFDGAMAADRAAPLIYWAWLRRLTMGLLSDELGPLFERTFGGRSYFEAVDAILARNDAWWCDDKRTPPGPASGFFQLRGRWANVSTNSTTPTFTVPLNEGYNEVVFNTPANIRERSAYLYVNQIHAHMKNVLPDFTGMDFQMPTRLDLTTDNCNAFYDGSSINFYAEGNNCRSLATINDVVYHEYGHGINDKFYTSLSSSFVNGAMNEGYADVWGLTLTQSPVLGLGMRLDNDNSSVRRYDVDPKVYHRRDTLVLKSLADALARLAGPDFAAAFGGTTDLHAYRWGKLHRIVLDHPLGGPFSIPPAFGTLPHPLGAALPGFPTDGGFGVVDASNHDPRAQVANAFMYGNGPVNRFVAEAGPPAVRAATVWPGGTSALPGSPFYANLLPLYLTNDTVPLLFGRHELRQNQDASQRFVPGRLILSRISRPDTTAQNYLRISKFLCNI